MSQEIEDQVEDNALGFSSDDAPKEEKYNTRYLVANMQKERKQSLLMAAGVVVAGVLGLWLLLSLTGGSSPLPAPAPAGTAEAQAADAPKADAPSPEAAKPEATKP